MDIDVKSVHLVSTVTSNNNHVNEGPEGHKLDNNEHTLNIL